MSNPREKIQSAREALERSDRAGANAEELRELRKAVGAVVDLVEGMDWKAVAEANGRLASAAIDRVNQLEAERESG